MKGTLHKTKQGWVVRYNQRTWQDPSAEDGELPLHPYQDPNYEFGRDMDGEEVEFYVEEFWETGITAPFNVAKLINIAKLDYNRDMTPAEQLKSIANGLENKRMLLEEDIWCVHKYLDDINIPRNDGDGKQYSIVGRIKMLQENYLKQMSDLETTYLNNDIREVIDDDVEKLAENNYSLESAKEFATKHFKGIKTNYPKGGLMTIENIHDVLKVGVECGYKFATKQAKETLYTKKQVREAIELARMEESKFYWTYYPNEIIESLKTKNK